MDKSKIWVRIDNRLVHGQVIETWIPYSNAKAIVVVNDELAQDQLQQEIMRLAVPRRIKLFFSSISEIVARLESYFSKNSGQVFLLFYSCQDAAEAFEQGLDIDLVNIGNIHYAPGKRQICDHIALSKDDIKCLQFFYNRGVKLDFRCVPNKQVQVKAVW